MPNLCEPLSHWIFHPSSTNDVQIGLDMDLTGLTNYYIQTLTDVSLLVKADISITFTKSEVDNRIANLVDSAPATLNTLKEVATALNNDKNLSTSNTNLIGTKANQSTTYTKTEVEQNLILKANQSTTYAKTEVDNNLALS